MTSTTRATAEHSPVSRDHQARPASPSVTDRRWVTAAGVAYAAAWLVGLAVKPAGVTSADSTTTIVANLVDHRPASLVQVLLVHAVAAVALLVVAKRLVRLVRLVRPARPAVARWAGRAAWTVLVASLAQAVLGVVMIATAGILEASATHGMLVGIERLDAAKLVALAGVCALGFVLARVGSAAGWSGWLASAAIACLVPAALGLGGVVPAFVPMAVPALVLLIGWVGSVAFALVRTRTSS